MKTKTFVEQEWIHKAEEIWDSAFPEHPNKLLRIKDECAKEVMWFISSSPTEIDLSSRIEKYKRMEEHASILVRVDPYWKQRLEFLQWILD